VAISVLRIKLEPEKLEFRLPKNAKEVALQAKSYDSLAVTSCDSDKKTDFFRVAGWCYGNAGVIVSPSHGHQPQLLDYILC
jgi:hypothetical protein